jgi:hypothetical protein
MGSYIKHALGLSQLQQLVVLLGGGKGLAKAYLGSKYKSKNVY